MDAVKLPRCESRGRFNQRWRGDRLSSFWYSLGWTGMGSVRCRNCQVGNSRVKTLTKMSWCLCQLDVVCRLPPWEQLHWNKRFVQVRNNRWWEWHLTIFMLLYLKELEVSVYCVFKRGEKISEAEEVSWQSLILFCFCVHSWPCLHQVSIDSFLLHFSSYWFYISINCVLKETHSHIQVKPRGTPSLLLLNLESIHRRSMGGNCFMATVVDFVLMTTALCSM